MVKPAEMALFKLTRWRAPRTMVRSSSHSRYLSKKCIYSSFSSKIGCHGNAPLSLVYGSVTDEFIDSTNPISKPNCAWICCIQPNLCLFLWYFAYFGQNLVAMATPLRLSQSEMSYLDWSILKPYPRTENLVSSCYTSKVMSNRRFATSLALGE